MKVWRKITAIVLLLPFLLSVTGVLVFRTQCHCTGLKAVSLYVMPETCGSQTESHHHLFENHAADLKSSCHSGPEQVTSDPMQNCGCGSPDVRFFKLKNQFTDEKGTLLKVKLTPVSLALLFAPRALDDADLNGPEASVDEPSPPLFTPEAGIIYYICQPKIPGLI
jgi:hypothetical protein